ncbi:MAG TPA: c-type cytochrome [Methylocystis sp.]|jgi:glucose/arabinose dehydrogenase/mono/diheme cytochrome c family protein
MDKNLLGRASLAIIAALALAQASASAAQSESKPACPRSDAGITLPPGFCATIFADGVGHARHMAVSADGTVYVNTWSGSYYAGEKTPAGGFLVALQDKNGDGKADVVERFGETHAGGGSGGTGVALYDGGLYAEEGARIVRYPLAQGEIVPSAKAETVIFGTPLRGDHPMHPFAIDAQGNLYLDSASATNSCQARNRMLESPGLTPCKELETRAGVWRYDAKKRGQKFSPAERFATGIRNAEGIAVDGDRIFATQHGRDQLSENWPRLYTPRQGADLPAEELLELRQGADYGWPECYYDDAQKKLVLAPEYGGDGGRKIGVCAEKQGPIAAFPAHWAPNALLVYSGGQFPAAYRGGFFIAFHGSWNRAPFPQGGYNVVFQPVKDGRPAGGFIVFADGFAGAVKEPGGAAHRPSGLAQGPDGALYVSDDVSGRIWRVTYHGDLAQGLEAAPSPGEPAQRSQEVGPPEGVNPEAGRLEGKRLPPPPGATEAEATQGELIFNGHAAGGTCAGCHGENGKGAPLGPDLTRGKWLWGDGSLASITKTIAEGVAQPKEYRSPMPPKGGAPLTDSDVAAVSAYVWAISRQKEK